MNSPMTDVSSRDCCRMDLSRRQFCSRLTRKSNGSGSGAGRFEEKKPAMDQVRIGAILLVHKIVSWSDCLNRWGVWQVNLCHRTPSSFDSLMPVEPAHFPPLLIFSTPTFEECGSLRLSGPDLLDSIVAVH